MKIHKEGYKIIRNEIIILIFIGIISNFNIYILSPLLLLLALTLYFFRVPKRILDRKDNIIYAPCDGKVVVIEKTIEKEFYKSERRQISIFMSPLNAFF